MVSDENLRILETARRDMRSMSVVETRAAQTGAALAELVSRLGHSTPRAALRYQHVAAGRDQAIAEALRAPGRDRRLPTVKLGNPTA